MHLDIGIVSTNIWPYFLSTISDDQNTITFQSSDMNDAPRDPLLVPVTWNPAQTRSYSTLSLCLCLWLRLRQLPHASPMPSQSPQALNLYIKIPPIAVSGTRRQRHHHRRQFRASIRFQLDSTHLFSVEFNSHVFDLIILTCFLFDQTHLFFDLIRLTCFSI